MNIYPEDGNRGNQYELLKPEDPASNDPSHHEDGKFVSLAFVFET